MKKFEPGYTVLKRNKKGQIIKVNLQEISLVGVAKENKEKIILKI